VTSKIARLGFKVHFFELDYRECSDTWVTLSPWHIGDTWSSQSWSASSWFNPPLQRLPDLNNYRFSAANSSLSCVRGRFQEDIKIEIVKILHSRDKPLPLLVFRQTLWIQFDTEKRKKVAVHFTRST